MTGGAAVDAVLFDLGRVLVDWDPFRPYEGLHPRAEVEEFFAEIDFPSFNHEQDAGRSWADARAALATTHPHRVGMLDVYVDRFERSVVGEIAGAAATVDALREAGVRVLGLSNWPAETFHVAGRKAPVVRRLEQVVVSGEVGLAKPDPRIFTLAVDRMGLDPGRTLFTDDLPHNIEAAAACGLRTELFTGMPALQVRLRELGVALPDEFPA